MHNNYRYVEHWAAGSRFLKAALCCLLPVLVSCSGGGGGEVDVSYADAANEGWLNITYPTTASSYDTEISPQYISGDAFGYPTSVTVIWENEATGQSAQADQHAEYCWFLGWYPCNHVWSANIPVIGGSNRIVVTATDTAGNIGRGILTVTRPPDTVAPTVISTWPAANDSSVDPSSSVTAQFSEPIDPATLANTSFTLQSFAGIPVDGTVMLSTSGTEATFKPAVSLATGGTYTAALTTQVADLSGNPLAVDYVWTFETAAGDTTPPTIVSTFPFPGATNVALNETIGVTFSELVSSSSLTTSTFRLTDSGGNPVAGSVSVLGASATFAPANPLEQISVYTAELNTGVTDLAGNALESNYTWSFTTTIPDTTPPQVTSTTPGSDATGVAIDGSLTVEFSEAMNQTTINASTFLLSDSRNNPVSGTVQRGIFKPDGKLSLAERYTATITIGATDLAGNPLAAPYVWSFTTTPDGVGSWSPVSTNNAPSPRQDSTAVWTGQEMIVWGGYNGSLLNSGGRYNPATDSWKAVSMTNAPAACYTPLSAWTGQEMIVWCGSSGAGGRYNPVTDRWTSISTLNAPSGINHSTAVWTGQEMIVWGGYGSTYSNRGARYNPSTDTWQPTTMTNAPAPRVYHTAVWTGSEMIVWGGDAGISVPANTGGRYSPDSDSWISISNAAAPYNRAGHVAQWTGSRMLVWTGGENSGSYNPATDSWSSISGFDALIFRYFPLSAWTGNKFVVWGGQSSDSGGIYDPSTDSWNLISYSGAPSGIGKGASVWTGSEFIVWAGPYANTGGRYKP